jgi:outer membrane receptor protein involved in Fe transport
MRRLFKPKLITLAVLSVYALPSAVLAEVETLQTEKIEVISTTPLQGIGLPINKVPAAVQTIKGRDLEQQKSTSVADYMNNNLMGVSVNETQNNPYQPDILFRGFTASPLLGTPQGLSVFQDGVRVNEPFGDAVNWDLIPVNAISGINLIPGSNPVFGLNTLGGSLSVVTKNGRTHQGGAIEVSGGSWDRKNILGEFGGVSQDGSIDYFISGNYFDEQGWRDYSPTEVKQLFGKLGWQNETTRLELSYTGADNDMIGNGLIQKELMDDEGRETINTRPDQTKNTLSFLSLNGSHWFNDDVEASGNVYYRKSDRKTLNGDVNDDFNEDDNLDGFGDADTNLDGDIDAAELAAALAACSVGTDSEFNCSGALNRSKTRQKGYGLNAQLAFNQPLFGKENQLITGFGYDYSKIDFEQSTEFGLVNASRGVDGTGEEGDEAAVNLSGKTKSWGVFATDTLSLNDQWALTLSGRYNHINVKNSDKLTPDTTDPESLSGDHSFNRFNPAVGLTFSPNKAVTLYGSYNEGMRAPTSMELGCANPAVPCKLPNAMAGDPPLKKVVAKTYEFGARGALTTDIDWTAAVYRTVNHDDIQFISTNATNGMGYFDNVGKTRRQGLDLGVSGNMSKFSWNVGYSYVKATYQSALELSNEVNSTVSGDSIQVSKGDQLANIPEHALKLRLQYQATSNWSVGTTINTFSDVYVRGNENNDHQANDGDDDHVQDSGKISGYTVVNLDTRYTFGNSGWQVFAKATNIFDKKYSTGGMLGENWFEDGAFAGDDEPSLMLMPGAPRAGWIGARYEFGKK